MVDYLSAWSSIILLCNGSFHADEYFWCFLKFWYHTRLPYWCIQFYFPNFVLAIYLFLGVTAEFFLGRFFKLGGFAGCTCWNSSGYASTISTLRGSASVNGFYLDEFFIWVLSWFTRWRFTWYAHLTGTLGGIAGEVAFMNIPSRDINASLCAFTSVSSGLAGSGLCSTLIKSYAVWTVASAEDIVGMPNRFGKNLLCLIFILLLFWEHMPYRICSVTLMVLCTIRILHVVPIMIYFWPIVNDYYFYRWA